MVKCSDLNNKDISSFFSFLMENEYDSESLQQDFDENNKSISYIHNYLNERDQTKYFEIIKNIMDNIISFVSFGTVSNRQFATMVSDTFCRLINY